MKTLKTLTMAFFTLAIFSCGKKQSKLPLDLLPVKFTKGGKISLMKLNGEIVLADEFSSESDVFSSEGIIYEKNESGVHYYTIDGKKLNEIKLDNKYEIGTPFHEGYALVSDEDGLLSFIDKTGKEIFNLASVVETNIVRAGIVSDGLVKIKSSNGLWGFINMDGKLVIKPEYAMVENFVNGKARVKKTDGMICVIDQKNNVLFTGKSKYNYYPLNSNDEFVFKDKGANSDFAGIQNLKGETVIKDVKFKEIDNSKSTQVMVVKNENGLYGIIDGKGDYVGELRCKFVEAPIILKKGFAVCEDKKIKLFDADGRSTKQVDGYQTALSFDQEYLIGISSKNNALFQILDLEGKELLPENIYLHSAGEHIKAFILNYIRYGKGSFENNLSLESTYVDFEKNFAALFASVNPKGLLQLTAQSNIVEVHKVFNTLKTKQKQPTSQSKATRTLDYNYVFSSKDLSTQETSEAVAAKPDISAVDTSIEESSVTTSAPDPNATSAQPKIVDPYNYISNYASSYSLNDIAIGDLRVNIYAQYSDYIKREIYGIIEDPIFKTSYTGLTGYELNPLAQLRSIQVSFTFDNSTMNNRLIKKLKEKIKSIGWKESGTSDLVNDSTANKIILSGNVLTFSFTQ